jgi:phosphate transport system permease protein
MPAAARTTRRPPVARSLARRRRALSVFAESLCVSATLIGLLFLAWILATLILRGAAGLSPGVFTNMTRPPGSHGGLLNAIVGSAIQVVMGTIIATPVGIMVGTYLAEYGGSRALGNVIRFISDVLLSAPSILVGLFVYRILVQPFGSFSAVAGSVALAVLAIPIVVRTTEDMLRLVPVSLREAAAALGAPRWKTIVLVCYPAARQGMVTGVMLAVARMAGETAPLLFTSFGNLNWSVALTKPMASLPVTIYQYAGSAFADWVQLAWTGALIITAGVLALNIAARVALRRR